MVLTVNCKLTSSFIFTPGKPVKMSRACMKLLQCWFRWKLLNLVRNVSLNGVYKLTLSWVAVYNYLVSSLVVIIAWAGVQRGSNLVKYHLSSLSPCNMWSTVQTVYCINYCLPIRRPFTKKSPILLITSTVLTFRVN